MALVVKNPPANAGDKRDAGSIPGSGRCPGGGHGNPLQYSFLPEESHREKSLVGYSPYPQGCKESDMTEVTYHAHMDPWESVACWGPTSDKCTFV